ncbi:MAG: hypothetical protein ACK5QC_09240 [Bacteroidota bacterium]|jgi:hypothetical protein|nr:SprB repeat-containing protein [Bacteroidota bacterium]MCA6443375.1 SprB repeat-containing protein [Bacteroidota bacterium]
MKKVSILFLLVITLLSGYKDLNAQCSGCTTNVTNNSITAYTVVAGQTLCIASGLNYTGTITLNGGTICNLGTLNNVTLLRGNFRNYGTFTRPSINAGLTGTITLENFEGSNILIGALTFSASNAAHIFQLNVYKGSIATFTGAVTHNSGNFRIEVGKDNPGGSLVSTSTLEVNGLFTTKTAFNLYVNQLASSTFSNIVSLEGTGIKAITNYGNIVCLNNLNMISAGSSASTVTINNHANFSVAQFVNANYTAGRVFINNYAANGDVFTINKSLTLSRATNTLNNSGKLEITENLNSVLGLATNNATITTGILSATGGTINNNGFIRAITDFSVRNTSTRLNNNNTIEVGNTFTNTTIVNFGTNSYLYTSNYYNTGTSAAINGPTATITQAQHPRIYVSNTSSNSATINKIMVYDASLTSTTSNIGYGFDAVSSPTRIASTVLFGSKGVSPGNGNSPTYSCSILNYYLEENVYSWPAPLVVPYSSPIQVSTYLYLVKKLNSNQIYESLEVPSDSYTIQPGNHIGNQSIYVAPLAKTTYTGSSTFNGCVFNDTLTAHLTLNVIPKITHTSNGLNNGSIVLDVGGGVGPYTYTWMPGNIHTKDITGLAQGTYSVAIKDNNNEVLNYVYEITNKMVWTKLQSFMYYQNDSIGPNTELVSKNTIRAGSNGWTQYKINDRNSSLNMFYGFSDSLSPVTFDYNDIDFGVYNNYGGIYVYKNGVIHDFLFYPTNGDVIKVEKNGVNFNIYRNGTSVYSESSASMTKAYKIKIHNAATTASYDLAGASFTDSTNMTFPNFVRTKAELVHSSGVNIQDGRITLNSVNNEADVEYNFPQLGIIGNQLTSVNKGQYIHVSKDNDNITSYYTTNLNYKIGLQDIVNGSFINDTLSASGSGYVMARSINNLGADKDGEFNYVIDNVTQLNAFVGFLRATDTYTDNANDFDFGFYIAPYSNNISYIYHVNITGTYTYLWSLTVGDIVTLSRSSGSFQILVNGKLLYSEVDPNVGIDRKIAIANYYTHKVAAPGVWFYGCIAPLDIIVNGAPTINFVNTQPANLNAFMSAGVPPVSYVWTPNYFFNSPTYNNSMQNTQVKPPVSMMYTVNATDAIGCVGSATVELLSLPYAHLNKIPDGGYYQCVQNKLLFKFDGQYATTGLKYNVYDKANTLIASNTFANVANSLIVNSGDNRYYLNVSGTSFLTGAYYNLEIINEKNEKLYLRFKK